MIIKINKRKFSVKVSKNMLSHFIGLMFQSPKNDGMIFIFKKEMLVSLHMLFVFIKIDIIYIDKNKKIKKIIKNVKPFTLFIKSVKCKYIMEVKNAQGSRLGEKISFI